jgi:putative toxin-antitoxin system antitoxin component (TIGR02293 family)
MATTLSIPDSEVADLLGGTRVLGSLKEAGGLQHAIRAGLPYAALEALEAVLEIPQAEVTAVLGTAPRTLARRKRRQFLSPTESDRLYRLARITRLAAQTLGELAKARAWLRRPNRALGGQTPLSLLDTEIGARRVEEALTRVNYGMYA